MKRVVPLALAAASMIAMPVAAQAKDQRPQSHQIHKSYKAPDKQTRTSRYHRFDRGERFERTRAANYRTLDHRSFRGLKAPGRNAIYVRAGNDILLINTRTNRVVAVYHNRFR
jgi:Ni/Co efflux regulator RcnB